MYVCAWCVWYVGYMVCVYMVCGMHGVCAWYVLHMVYVVCVVHGVCRVCVYVMCYTWGVYVCGMWGAWCVCVHVV